MPETIDKKTEDAPSLTGEVEIKAAEVAAESPKAKKGSFFKFKKIENANIDSAKLNKLAYPAAIVIIVLVLFWFMGFLYANVYETIALGQNITSLKAQVIGQNLNENEFNKILELTKNKNAGALWRADNLNNPFIYAARIIKPMAASPIASTTLAAPVFASTTSSTPTSTLPKN